MNSGHRIYVSCSRQRLDFDKIVAWTLESYWGHQRTEAQIRASLQNSTVFGVFKIEATDRRLTQVGFARIISDHWTSSMITDVYVDEAFRGQGFGRALMEAVVEHPSVARTLCILGTRDAAGFYRKFGFFDTFSQTMQRNPTP